jgi:hypothetical protein
MADSTDNNSESPAPDDEDSVYLRALEDERQRLMAVKTLREGYVRHLNELSDENWPGNVGKDEAQRFAEIDDIRQRLRNMASWDEHYRQRIAEGEDIYRRKKDLEAIGKAARERQAAIKNKRQQQALDSLISRSFNPTCDWDRKHVKELFTLALWPERSSLLFRLRNRVHTVFHHR